MDTFSRTKRSEIMARIRSENTVPELRLYDVVRAALGPRWKIDRNVVLLPGRPDMVVPSLRLAIFAHGCFFHGCQRHSRVPRSNEEYWIPKISGNVRRHHAQSRKLRALGYRVWTCWEHDLRPARLALTRSRVTRRIDALLRTRSELARRHMTA